MRSFTTGGKRSKPALAALAESLQFHTAPLTATFVQDRYSVHPTKKAAEHAI